MSDFIPLARLAPAVLIMAGALFATPAPAAEFLLTYSSAGDPNTVSATLTTTDTTTDVGGRQAYTILGLSGVHGAGAITGLFPTGYGFYAQHTDNYLFMDGGSFFSRDGFGFAEDAITYAKYEVISNYEFFDPSDYFELEFESFGPGVFLGYRRVQLDVQPGRLPPSGAPEPETWALLILGFGAAGSVLRKRRAVGGLKAAGA